MNHSKHSFGIYVSLWIVSVSQNKNIFLKL